MRNLFLLVILIFLSGCSTSNIKDALEGSAPGYSFNTTSDFKSTLKLVNNRFRQCLEGNGVSVEYKVENNGQSVIHRYIANINGGFLVMASLTSNRVEGAEIDVRYTSSWKSQGLAIKHWITSNNKLCSSYSIGKPENFVESLKENYQVRSDIPFKVLVNRVSNLFHECSSGGYTLIDFTYDYEPAPIAVLSSYGSGPFSIFPRRRVELKKLDSGNETVVTVWYTKGVSAYGKAIGRWVTENYQECRAK